MAPVHLAHVAVAAVMLTTAAASRFSHLRFPDESKVVPEKKGIEDSGQLAAIAEWRAQRVAQFCNILLDPLSPESTAFHSLMPDTGTDNWIVFGSTLPAFQVCSPRHGAWHEAWMDFKSTVSGEAENVVDVDLASKNRAKRMKLLALIHPLQRLAQVYVRDFRDGQGSHFDIIRNVYNVDSSQLSFKNFVHFLTTGAADFSSHMEVLQDADFNRPWAPVFQECSICNRDNAPHLVLKADDLQQLETEFEDVKEIFGLEEFDFPFDKISTLSEATLKSLYGQLTEAEFNDLVDVVQVDLRMFHYSPKYYADMLRR